jgi:hypothetical protein
MLVGTARAERAKAERASRFVRTRVDMGRGTRVFPIAYSVIGQGCRGPMPALSAFSIQDHVELRSPAVVTVPRPHMADDVGQQLTKLAARVR